MINSDGSLVHELDLAGEGITVGDSGVTFMKTRLSYGLYCFKLMALMEGHREFNATTYIYARVLGKAITEVGNVIVSYIKYMCMLDIRILHVYYHTICV